MGICHEQDGITLYHGDNVQTMRESIPDASIDLVVTSPPYDNLRTYGGHTWDFEGLAQQLWRVIKPGGVVVWVVADATIDGSETGTSFRQALHFKELGFRLHDTMIWEKVDPSPGDGKFRYHNAWEFMFVFSSGEPSARNMIRDVPCESAGKVDSQNWDRRRDESSGGTIRKPWVRPDFGFRRNVWKTGHGGHQADSVAFDHPAVFPEALARDHILSWSNEGDTVLDPFSGSGTTIKMARLMGRKGIGIEIHQEYCDIAVERLRQRLLF
jgi:site-specific DNA-methyltransferase (adenine-specific)